MNIQIKIAAVAVLLGAGLDVAVAQTPSGRNDVQPEAVNALKDVGAKLRSLRGYSVDADVQTRAALGDGRYRDFAGTIQYLVRPPEHLAADISGKAMSRRVLYDGVTITVQDPAQQRYARVQAPGTLQTLLDRIGASKGIELPIAEMFTWGVAGTPMSAASRARYEGTAMMRKRPCKHYSYLENGVAWEVWIDQANLACKLVVVDTTDRGLPGYSAELQWDTDRKPADSEFVFEPSAGAREVPLAQLAQGDETAKP